MRGLTQAMRTWNTALGRPAKVGKIPQMPPLVFKDYAAWMYSHEQRREGPLCGGARMPLYGGAPNRDKGIGVVHLKDGAGTGPY